MHVDDFKLIVEAENDKLELREKIAFKTAQLNILNFINSYRRPLTKDTSYYRISIEDIINYIEKL